MRASAARSSAAAATSAQLNRPESVQGRSVPGRVLRAIYSSPPTPRLLPATHPKPVAAAALPRLVVAATARSTFLRLHRGEINPDRVHSAALPPVAALAAGPRRHQPPTGPPGREERAGVSGGSQTQRRREWSAYRAAFDASHMRTCGGWGCVMSRGGLTAVCRSPGAGGSCVFCQIAVRCQIPARSRGPPQGASQRCKKDTLGTGDGRIPEATCRNPFSRPQGGVTSLSSNLMKPPGSRCRTRGHTTVRVDQHDAIEKDYSTRADAGHIRPACGVWLQ